MNKTSFFLGALFAEAMIASAASSVDISDATFVSYSTNVSKLVVTATSADKTLPAEAGTPNFHFDCLRTNEAERAWTFAGETVTRVPSLSNDRFLTADFTTATWQGWSDSSRPLAPLWTFDAEIGSTVLDFGAVGSKRALTFDAASGSGNGLSEIGTVFAVVKNRGGWLMGGSMGSEAKDRYAWHRGSSVRKKGGDANAVDSPIFGVYANDDLKNATLRLNGRAVTDVMKCGFSGGWDYLTLRTKTASVGALGLGIGDARTKELDGSDMSARSGGLAFAELIVYPTQLSDDLCRRVEAYLARKWLDADYRGCGAYAAASDVRVACTTSDAQYHDVPPDDGSGGMQGEAEVPDGQVLAIGRLRGGRGMSATFAKTGSGTLKVGDVSALGGRVLLSEGTLAFARRPIPTSLPTGVALRFDASDGVETSDEDGVAYVARWSNLGDETLHGQPCYAGAADAASRPVLVANAVNGRPAVDFGSYATDGTGCLLHLMTNNDQRVSIASPATYVAVLAANEGGGHLIGTATAFRRGEAPTDFWKPLLSASAERAVWVDGLKVAPTAGYATPDSQVTAAYVGNETLSCIGGGSDTLRGGAKICELVVYKIPLSDRQLEDAQAYLAWKWLGRVLPGYAQPAEVTSARPDIQDLVVGEGAVDVPSGASVRIGRLSGASLVKKGAGELGLGVGSAPQRIDVQDGSVCTLAAPTVTETSACAREPVFHVASDEPASLDVETENGVDYVVRWHDLSASRNAAWCPRSKSSAYGRPKLNREDLLNGRPTVDFGAVGSSGSTLSLSRSIDNARAVYVVYKAVSTANYAVLGTSGETALDAGGSSHAIYSDFLGGSGSRLLYGFNNRQVTAGDIFLDGASVAYTAILSEGYHLAEFHTRAGAHISAIARDRMKSRVGGVRVAEILVYDRELTARERVATRNFLLAKWFPKAAQQELPSSTDEAASAMGELVLSQGGAIDVSGSLKVRDLVGEPSETVVKRGEGTLEVCSAVAFTGTVAVASGVLRLSGVVANQAVTGPVERGCLARFDAGAGLGCDAFGQVTNWQSQVGTLRAVPYVENGLTRRPEKRADIGVFGHPSVCLPSSASLRLADANGDWTTLSGVKSVAWVIGTQEGGGFVLAGAPGTYSFHRGSASGDWPVGAFADRPILSSVYAGGDIASTAKCAWRLNGEAIDPTVTGFNAAWEILSMNLLSDDGQVPDIGGFAADARIYQKNEQSDRAGRQRLCEVIFYNRVLTAEEVAANEAYLNAKWGVLPIRTARQNGLSVILAGGSLDCAGTDQYVDGLAGSGEIRNGNLTIGRSWTIALSEAGAEAVSAAGGLAFEPRLVIRLENASAWPKSRWMEWLTVATADSVTGVQNLKAAQVEVPGLDETVYPQVRVVGKDVKRIQVRLLRSGALFIIR